MSRITLTNLRSAIYNYLDDDGTRWTAGTENNALDMSTPVDRAIKYSLQAAIRFYIKNGNEGLLIQKTFTTDSNGQVSLDLTDPDTSIWISNVSLRDGNTWAAARATRADEVEYQDQAIRDIRVNFIPEPYIVVDVINPVPPVIYGPNNGKIAFLGAAEVEIPELEILTILYAVKNLIPRDAEQNMALNDAIFQAENSITGQMATPLAVEFPRHGRAPSVYYQYRWAFIKYDADTNLKNVIQIHRPLYSFYDVVT